VQPAAGRRKLIQRAGACCPRILQRYIWKGIFP
jgi:hypothetical protein